jgi:hypothetical protein
VCYKCITGKKILKINNNIIVVIIYSGGYNIFYCPTMNILRADGITFIMPLINNIIKLHQGVKRDINMQTKIFND